MPEFSSGFGIQEYLVLDTSDCDTLFPFEHVVENGMVYVSDGPGLGVDFDETEAAKCEYKAGSHPVVRLQDGTPRNY